MASYRKALKIDPSCARAHYNLGNALAGQNLLHEAMAEWQIAVNLQPDYADANYNLGLASIRQGRIDDAIGFYRKALATAPDNPRVLHNLRAALASSEPIRKAVASAAFNCPSRPIEPLTRSPA